MDLEAINLRNQQDSPLLRIPPELRLEIYKYALGGHDFVLYPRSLHDWIIEEDNTAVSAQDGLHPLLLTCRFIRHEAKDIRITTNTFTVIETRPHSLKMEHLFFLERSHPELNLRDSVGTFELCIDEYSYIHTFNGKYCLSWRMSDFVCFKGLERVKVSFLPGVVSAFSFGPRGPLDPDATLVAMRADFLRPGWKGRPVEFVKVLPPERLFSVPETSE